MQLDERRTVFCLDARAKRRKGVWHSAQELLSRQARIAGLLARALIKTAAELWMVELGTR